MFRDIFWTVIIVWLIYKLVDIFRSAGQKKKYAYQQNDTHSTTSNHSTTITKKDVKSALQKRADKEGEYVDFEDVK